MSRLKGIVYMLEVSVAVLMILSLILIVPKVPRRESYSLTFYQLQALNALETLDNLGLLREVTLNKDVNTLSEKFGDLMSNGINYRVVLFNSTTNVTEFETIDANEVYSVSYFIVGDHRVFEPMEIRVYLWK